MSKFRVCKCYFCKEDILKEEDREKINVSKMDNKIVLKNIHKECVSKYEEKRNDYNEWCKVYDYFRYQVLGYKNGMQLPKFCKNKIQGLRVGDFVLKKGKKIELNSDGYPYKIILITMMMTRNDMEYALKTKVFKSENEKIAYLIGIIMNNINDVYLRILEGEKSKERLRKQVDKKTEEEQVDISYENKNKLIKNKISKDLEELI